MKLDRENIELRIIPILKKYEVKKAALFGSYARGEETESSDVDVLIEFKVRKTLIDLVGLEQEIEEELQISTDVITYNSIYHRLRDIILKEEKVFYEEGTIDIS